MNRKIPGRNETGQKDNFGTQEGKKVEQIVDSDGVSPFFTTLEAPQIEELGPEGFIRPVDPFRKTGEGVLGEEIEDLEQRLIEKSQPGIVDLNESPGLNETVLAFPEGAEENDTGCTILKPVMKPRELVDPLDPQAGTAEDPQTQELKNLLLSDIDSDIAICVESSGSQTDYVTANEEISSDEGICPNLPTPLVRRSTRTRKKRTILSYDPNFEPRIVRYGSLNLICMKYDD